MRAIAAVLAATAALAATFTAFAQDAHGAVGTEVFSTSTPGGGGQLQSQGVNGTRTPWTITESAPSLPGVVNVVVTYYHCKECRDKAKEEKDKKKEEEKKKKKGAVAPKEDDKKVPPAGDPVPTFDPRFWQWKDGKLVPVEDHSKCPKPEKFECGQHYDWWLKNHEHKASKPEDHSRCDQPTKFECGAHYQWWLQTHRHIEPNGETTIPIEILELDLVSPKPITPQRTDDKQSLLPSDKQVFVTGTVVQGEKATGTVLDPNGAVLAGVVVELSSGEEIFTDEYGRFTYTAPKDTNTLVLSIGGAIASIVFVTEGAGSTHARANAAGEIVAVRFDGPREEVPMEEVCINFAKIAQVGTPAYVAGSFPAGSTVKVDDQEWHTLASSSNEIVLAPPADLEPGSHVATLIGPDGRVLAVDTFEAVRLTVEASDKTLLVGQPGRLQVRVEGTEQPVEIRVTNLTPDVIAMTSGSQAMVVKSSGGPSNFAIIPVKALKPGGFKLPVRLVKKPIVRGTQSG